MSIMGHEESRELLDTTSLSEEEEEFKDLPSSDYPRPQETIANVLAVVSSCNLFTVWNRYRVVKLLYLILALCLAAFSLHHFDAHIPNTTNLFKSEHQSSSDTSAEPASPFNGVFSRFPRISALPPRQKRITVVGVWNDNSTTTYLRHFLYTIQLNADHLDLLMINRLTKPDSECLDWEKAGLNITWGGNVNVECVTNNEWNRRHVNFMCSPEHGWNCTSAQYDDVLKEYEGRKDPLALLWRPFRGFAFYDLFPNKDNPFWAWMDTDVFVGNFAHYPYNLLSQLSIVTGSSWVPQYLYMAGQLTAFNMDDEALWTAWKKFPALQSADHFTKYTRGRFPESAEERYWSYGYLGSQAPDFPGTDLSYAVYPDIHGDDFFHGSWKATNLDVTYVISGREILLVSTEYTRQDIEVLISIERSAPVDDLGGVGWTPGEDGSQYLFDNPDLPSDEAKQMAIEAALRRNPDTPVQEHRGIVDDQEILHNCSTRPKWKQCVEPDPSTTLPIPFMRASLLRLKGYKPNHVLRRLEFDHRPRGYERKLIRHHLKSKHRSWWAFPPFEITEDLVLRYNNDMVEVWRMGDGEREKTLFFRKWKEQSIG